MLRLKSITFIFIYIIYVNADDGGLSDIPFNGTPDDVADAYRTKLAVELAEKVKTSTLNKKILNAISGGQDIVGTPAGIGAPVVAGAPAGVGGVGARVRDPRPIDINAAGGRTFGNEITSFRNIMRL